jgi:hypothetical protein
LFLVAYISGASATPYSSAASEIDFSGSVQRVNLVGSKTKDSEWIDPRGLLTVEGLELDTADYTDFTLDASSPEGRSYSNALQLNQDIIEQIERLESESGNAQPQ